LKVCLLSCPVLLCEVLWKWKMFANLFCFRDVGLGGIFLDRGNAQVLLLAV
jgi:hypothetical protein